MATLTEIYRRLLVTYCSTFVVLFWFTDLALPLLIAILALSLRPSIVIPVFIGIPIFVLAECLAVHYGLWEYKGPPKYLVPGYLPPLWGIAICLMVDIADATAWIRAAEQKRDISV